MGLLDFNDKEILRSSGIIQRKNSRERRQAEDNFGELQLMGHEKNSKDFSDSAFADRRKLCPSCLAGFSKEDIKGNCTCE